MRAILWGAVALCACVPTSALPPRHAHQAEAFFVNARGATRERRVSPKWIGGMSARATEVGAPHPLRMEMKFSQGAARLGQTVPVRFTITNVSESPLAVPISPNSADVEPPDPLATGYKFRRLSLWVRLPGMVGLRGGATLYGDPSLPGTTHVLGPSESVVVAADVQIAPTSGPPLQPGTVRLRGFASLDDVTVSPRDGSLSEFGAEIAWAESPPVKLEIVPQN